MAHKLPFNSEINFEYGAVSWITPTIRRIVANNPSPFTFKGTNTYIVGKGEVALIDPGPDLGDHFDAIINATKSEKITHILLTHTHLDHVGALNSLKEYTGAQSIGYGPTQAPRGTREQSPSNSEFVENDVNLDRLIRDGDSIQGQNWKLEALHTPGHAPDHFCYAFNSERILFSGDHVMGWNTSVIAPPEGNMKQYLASLKKLLDRDDKLFLPGHGGRVTAPNRLVKAFILHRQWRESAIIDCLKSGQNSINQIVEKMYSDLTDDVETAASLSVLAHLELLIERGIASCDGAPSLHSFFSLA